MANTRDDSTPKTNTNLNFIGIMSGPIRFGEGPGFPSRELVLLTDGRWVPVEEVQKFTNNRNQENTKNQDG
jgi:hypothetical protein